MTNTSIENAAQDKVLQNIMTIAQADPEELAIEMVKKYCITLPEEIETPEDLTEAGRLLGYLANNKTFLFSLLTYLKVRARAEKNRGKENKRTAEEMAMRRDVVELILDSVKGQYDAISRMVTVRKNKIDEMRMLGL